MTRSNADWTAGAGVADERAPLVVQPIAATITTKLPTVVNRMTRVSLGSATMIGRSSGRQAGGLSFSGCDVSHAPFPAMDINSLSLTFIGGPTALLEIAGLRFLTDPTFDPAGSEYTTPVYTLRKTTGPAIAAADIGDIDAVLLSHDHHFDNLDRAGRALLPSARKVLTTVAGAERLGGNAIGLANWDSVDIVASDGTRLRVTGTP